MSVCDCGVGYGGPCACVPKRTDNCVLILCRRPLLLCNSPVAIGWCMLHVYNNVFKQCGPMVASLTSRGRARPCGRGLQKKRGITTTKEKARKNDAMPHLKKKEEADERCPRDRRPWGAKRVADASLFLLLFCSLGREGGKTGTSMRPRGLWRAGTRPGPRLPPWTVGRPSPRRAHTTWSASGRP